MPTILHGGGGNEQHLRGAVETPRGRESESHFQEIDTRYDDQPREMMWRERGDETNKQAQEREACVELLKMRVAKLKIISGEALSRSSIAICRTQSPRCKAQYS